MDEKSQLMVSPKIRRMLGLAFLLRGLELGIDFSKRNSWRVGAICIYRRIADVPESVPFRPFRREDFGWMKKTNSWYR